MKLSRKLSKSLFADDFLFVFIKNDKTRMKLLLVAFFR